MIMLDIELTEDLYCIVYDLDNPIHGQKFTLEDFRRDNWHEFKYETRVLEIKTYDNGQDLQVALCIDSIIIDSSSIPDLEANEHV